MPGGFATAEVSWVAPQLRLFSRQAELLELANRVASVVAARLGLIGLNGVDFIARQGVPYPIELNPRYSASMELIERAHRLSIFGVHALACKRDLRAIPPLPYSAVAHGKAIVFARQDSLVGDSRPGSGETGWQTCPGLGNTSARDARSAPFLPGDGRLKSVVAVWYAGPG